MASFSVSRILSGSRVSLKERIVIILTALPLTIVPRSRSEGGYSHDNGNGGRTYLQSTDLFEDGFFKPGPNLLHDSEGHCMVRLDQNRVLILGGGDGTPPGIKVSASFFFCLTSLKQTQHASPQANILIKQPEIQPMHTRKQYSLHFRPRTTCITSLQRVGNSGLTCRSLE